MSSNVSKTPITFIFIEKNEIQNYFQLDQEKQVKSKSRV
jgi:hypothetical protein